LLIIDDMGMKQLPKRSGEYLFEIIMRRYETRSTMMTSNRPLEDWGKLLGDVPTATAILDRFLHHAELVPMNGRSYRLRSQPDGSPSVPEDSKPAKRPPAPRAPRRRTYEPAQASAGSAVKSQLADPRKPSRPEKESRSEPETLNRPPIRLESIDVSETTKSRGWF